MTLGPNTLSFEVDADLSKLNRSVSRGADEAERDLERIEDGFEAVEEAAKTTADDVAAALNQKADGLVDELKGVERAAVAVRGALGDATDIDPVDGVRRLREFGLELDDIAENADQLVGALRRIDDVKATAAQSEFKNIGDGLLDTEQKAGRARDTLFSFTGGAAGELPLVADAIGPVGEGIGQLAEGLASGEVNLKQFIATGGGMVAVGALIQGVTSAWAAYREEQEQREENIRQATDALIEQSEAVNTLEESIERLTEFDPGEGGVVAAILGNLEEGQVDRLNAALLGVGLTYEELFATIGRSGTDLSEIHRQVFSTVEGLSAETVEQLVDVIGETDSLDEALSRLARNGATDQSFIALHQTLSDTSSELHRVYLALEEVDDAVDETDLDKTLTAALNRVTLGGGQAADVLAAIRENHPTSTDLQVYILFEERMTELAAASEAAAEADEVLTREQFLARQEMERAGEAAQGQADDLDDLADAAGDAAAEISDLEASASDLRNELSDRNDYLRLQQEFDRVTGAVDRASAATGEYGEESDEAAAAARDAEIATNGLALSILDYVENLDGIPASKRTEIVALVEDGELDEARRKIDELDGKTVFVQMRVNGPVYDSTGRPAHLDRGGPVPPGGAIIAERRPEFHDGRLVTEPTYVPGGGSVTSGAQTADILARAAAGSSAPRRRESVRVVVIRTEAPRWFNPDQESHIRRIARSAASDLIQGDDD